MIKNKPRDKSNKKVHMGKSKLYSEGVTYCGRGFNVSSYFEKKVRWTTDKSKVNCKSCLREMKKHGK